ncbi:MAG: glycosyltransferase [Candidatus Omnitrophota bacterium]|nr:MAG: glycosyltransferase [Candidatus Omnitrophota bacterium]
MNILQVTSRLDISDEAEDVIASTRFLMLNGHKVVVCSGKSGRIREIDEVGARHYPISFKPNIFLIPVFIFRLFKVILKENIQIVHARDSLSSFIAFFASRFTERVFIATIYRYHKKSVFERSQFWAKHVIFFSEDMARYFVMKGFVSQNKICVIPPFVSCGKSPLPANRDFFTVGTTLPLLSPEAAQNFIRIISILSRAIHKIKVFIIEGVPRHGRDYIERIKLLIRRHSLDNVVTFLSRDPDDARLLSGLDLFMQVKRDEGNLASSVRHSHSQAVFNGTRRLLRAQAYGVPIVTTDTSRIKNYKKLASFVLDLYRNKSLRDRMAGEGIKFVNEKCDIKKIMKSTMALYENAFSGRNILVIKIGALGDAILAIPSLRAIRRKFPKSKIKLLVGIDNKEVFMNCPFIDEIIVCDFKERDNGLAGLLGLARKLRTENFDIVVDLQNNKKSHILSFLSYAPKRYGYDNGKLSFLLNRKIKDTKFSLDPITHQSKVLGLLGIYNIDKRLELWPSKEDEAWADNFLKSHWIKTDTKFVVINIGSSPRWITKLWPPEYFAEVCNKLAKDFGIRVVLVGLEKRSARIDKFLRHAKCKPIDALARTNISRLASLVKRSGCLLSSDSAPIHVAAGVGTPYVAFFGPTDPKRHLAPTENYAVMKKDLKCSPCYHTYCNKEHMCMRSIKPNEVYKAVLKLLGIKV